MLGLSETQEYVFKDGMKFVYRSVEHSGERYWVRQDTVRKAKR